MSYIALLQALGDYADPFTGGYSGDDAGYRQWLAAVKAAGGTVNAYPWHGSAPFIRWTDIFGNADTWGLLSARYPLSRIYDALDQLRPPFSKQPDNATSTPAGDFGYYLAPLSILKWQLDGGLSTIGGGGVIDQTSPDLKPNWYEDLVKAAKYVGIGGAALAAVALLSFVPRRR